MDPGCSINPISLLRFSFAGRVCQPENERKFALKCNIFIMAVYYTIICLLLRYDSINPAQMNMKSLWLGDAESL